MHHRGSITATLTGLCIAASQALAQPSLQQILDEARGGLVSRTKELDAEGRIVERGEGKPPAISDEISETERRRILEELDANRARLVAEGKLARAFPKALTNFAWPLRLAAGRTDFDLHAISNYVDENPAFPNQLLDYNCGARTYDLASGYNHSGTDIFTWPFAWRRMDDEDLVVSAGAAGTIIGKTDGNDDRSCAIGSGTWNAVYVQHADGSVAWYGHMKKGSPTSKGVGETVAAGEYLGIVGSSGNSTGPHLHLELYDAANALVDPWIGPCNAKSKEVTWARQRPYRYPGVNALTVGTAPPNLPACPNPESSFATDYVTPGTSVYFTVYVRDQVTGEKVKIRVLRPDGTVFASPNAAAATTDYSAAYWYWFYSNFPNTPGTWTLEATLAGKLFTKTFQVGGSANYGAAAAVAPASGTPQSTAPSLAFAQKLRVRVLDALSRPVKDARVAFAAPASGASAVLESRTAVTDASGYAAVSALANAIAGSYSITATVAGVASPASFSLQNAAAATQGITASPAPVDFGGQSINTTSPAQAVTLTNTSGAPLTVSSVTVPAGFSVTHNCAALLAGAACTANVTFTPTLKGAVGGFLLATSGAGTTRAIVKGTGELSLVSHYYRSILRRAPDAGGKAFWENEAARVADLGASVNEVWFAMAQQFYFSPEYAAFNRNNSGFVTDLYTTFFNRAPDAGGLAYWLDQLNQGMPREVALASLMLSPEFAGFTSAIFGNTAARAETNTVVDFYRGLLARTPDDSGFAYWAGRFRAAQCAGAASITAEGESISSAYALSAEYGARARSNSQYVGDLYNAFLRRGGDLPGVQYWIGQIASGAQTREQVRVQFKNSAEFQQRVTAITQQGCV